jgi:hypothetical protein
LKSLTWFRLYAEAVDDEKLRLLAFEDRWHFVALLCCKARGILDEPDSSLLLRKVAVKLGLDLRELGEVTRRLAEVGLICKETLQPLAWDHRQFQSDSSSERVKAYRERVKRNGNVSETAQETETETETERQKIYAGTSAEVHAAERGNGQKKAERAPPCPYEALVEAYHETLPTLNRVVVLTDTRKAHMNARWREVWDDERFDQKDGVELFRGYFSRVSGSRFLTGRVNGGNGRTPFKADLEWLMKPGNFAKVLEGKYE